MTVDLTKLILLTTKDTFKNNDVWTGTLTISGNHSAGTNVKTFTVDLGTTPDLMDVVFNAPADPLNIDPRPASAYFKQGAVYEQAADGAGGYPVWHLNSSINGQTLTITATYTQTYTGTYTSPSTSFSYRVIDYSVF